MTYNPIKLSVVIITLNEEKNIERCLNAAFQVADEIVVVDSFSTDKTKEICKNLGAIFIEHKFEGYGKQKNYATSRAKYDFVLSLDADEVLSQKLINSILTVKENPKHEAYQLNRLSYYVDKFIRHGHWFPDKKIRLSFKESGAWSDDSVHETFELRPGVKSKVLKGVLYHYTFNSVFEHVRQANNFSEIGAKQLTGQKKSFLTVKAIISPIWGFLSGYILRLGFLDGWHGLTIAVISSHETFLKYAKAIANLKEINAIKHDVIHISSMKTWRGGEQQVANLVLGQIKRGIKPYMLVKKGSDLMKFCKLNRIPYSNLKFNNGFNIFSALKVKKISRNLGVSIVHMHCSPSHTLSIFSKLFGNPAKLILSRRVIFPVRSNALSYKKFNYSGISKIICVSESTREVMKKTVEDTAKLEVIYDGIDFSRFQNVGHSEIKKEIGLDGKRIVGNISAIVSEKDYFTFVDVAESVTKRLKDVHFVIVGDGGEYVAVQKYIENKGLQAHVSMLGFRKDVPQLLAFIDVFLMTSTMEGLGSTILDAFASKVPVVATNVGGIPEIVLHEETGLISNPKDIVSLSENVMRLLKDKQLVEKITNNAYNLVSTKFRTDTMVKLTNEVYENIA